MATVMIITSKRDLSSFEPTVDSTAHSCTSSQDRLSAHSNCRRCAVHFRFRQRLWNNVGGMAFPWATFPESLTCKWSPLPDLPLNEDFVSDAGTMIPHLRSDQETGVRPQ